METQKPKGEKSAYTGRFAASAAPKKRAHAASTRKQSAETSRRPSGFAVASVKGRGQNAASGAVKTGKSVQVTAGRKEKKPRPKKQARERMNHRRLKFVPVLLVVALILYLLFALIFGGQNRTVHQLPIVERESISEFAPEETPISGTEVQ